MRTTVIGRTAAVVAVGLVAACGSAPEAAGPGGTDGCDGTIEGPVTVRISTHVVDDPSRNPNPIAIYRDVIDEFNAGIGQERGITAEIVSYTEEGYEQQLTAAIQSGRVSDVVEVDAPFVGSFAYQEVIKPLGSCVPEGRLDSIIPSVVANGRYGDEQYTLGAYESGMGLWASRAALTGVGARIPTTAADAWTVEEFDTILRNLQGAGFATPLNIEWGYGAGEWRPFGFGPALLSGGGGLFNADNSAAEGALNSAESVRTLTWFQQWAQAGLLDLATASGANDTNFTSGLSAISWVGHWMEGSFSEALGDDLVLLPLPDFGTGSKVYTGSWSFGLAAGGTADPDAAWALLDYLTGPEASKSLAESENAVPADRSVYDADPAYQPGGDRYLYAQNLTDASVSFPRPVTPAYLVARDEFSSAFADIVGGADVQATLDAAAAAIDADIEANRGYPGS